MKIIVVLLLLTSAPNLSAAVSDEQSVADSLRNSLQDHTSPESRLLIIEQLIETYKIFDLDSALFFCEQYAQLATAENQPEWIARSNYYFASIYSISGDFEQMTTYAYPALSQYKELGSYEGQINILLLLGRMNASKREFQKAYDAYDEALIIADNLVDKSLFVMINLGISNAKFLEEDMENAEKYLFQCIDIVHNNSLPDSTNYLAKIYTNLGNINSAKTNDLEAIEYYKKSHQYYWDTNDKFGISLTAFNIGDVYNYNDMYDSALKYFNITLQMGTDLRNYEELYYAYLGFTELHERKGEYKKAFEYEKFKHAYADSLQIQKYSKAAIELEKKYEAEKKASELEVKDKEVKIAQREKEEKQSVIILLSIGGGMLAVLAISMLFLYRRVSRANELIKEQSKSIDKTLKQKEILLQEVHHRVKNNLQLIASLLNLQLMNLSDGTAKKAIEESKSRVQAIALMHKGLYQDDNYSSVDLKSYVNELVGNLKTLSHSSERTVNFNVSVDPIMLNIDQSVPIGLILSELISNSLKHAFKQVEDGQISVSIKKRDEQFVLNYSDNGCGLPENFKIEEQESLGFTVIQALTDQLGAKLHFDSYSPFELRLQF